MNADLEKTLEELGPEYRKVVDRLLSPVGPAFPPAESPQASRPEKPGRILFGWRAALVAASLVVGLGVTWFFADGVSAARKPDAPRSASSPYVLAYSADAASFETLVRTQRADGSWANDFLTRQNAAALRTATDAAAHVAYRRAVRYLRAKGLAPLTAAELRARGDFAAQVRNRS